ncbi:hypothetical protein AVEN_102819-1 [Araneus ventricosus]|uniref:MATH domain-containing protein n=1 Tax=Araneus ventricosus TaxID=182803 RepID=A0A4Y2WYN3_ARAVE|nr:hypothetical protein AVEN_102819-1 [Araneus ventricosus]
MACKQGDKKCFTFMWKLENASCCLQKRGNLIKSPAFVVDEIYETKWKLWLYPRGERDGDYIGFFLHRELDFTGATNVQIIYELAFIAKDGSSLTSHDLITHTFYKDGSLDFSRFEKRDDVFILKLSTFLTEKLSQLDVEFGRSLERWRRKFDALLAPASESRRDPSCGT